MKTKPEIRGRQTRESFLDFLRILACFLVIVNHTVNNIFFYRSPEEKTWFLSLAYFFLSKPAVLIFYMISGYLLLGRQDSWKTDWKRIRRILIVMVCCAAAYAVFHGFANDPNSTAVEMLREFLGIYRKPPSNALWYLYTYLGLLVMLPFLQKMAAAMEKNDYYILFGLTCFFVGTVPIFSHYNEELTVAWEFDLPLISNAVAMLFAGHYFARFGVRKTRAGFALAAVLVLAMVGLNTYATWVEYQRSAGSDYLFFDYRELLPNMIGAVCLFYMASFLRLSPAMEKVIACIGSCTFGMYLIGDILLDILMPVRWYLEGRFHVLIGMVLYQLVVFLCAFVVIAAVRRIPWVRKLI